MEYSEALTEVIKMSWFTVNDRKFVYTAVKKIVYPEKHLMLINDGEEITIVTAEENLSLLVEYKSNKERWRLINVRCGNPFYCVGFIAAITSALAEHEIDIVITSSFSNDLILVMEKDLEAGIRVLQGIGFKYRLND